MQKKLQQYEGMLYAAKNCDKAAILIRLCQ